MAQYRVFDKDGNTIGIVDAASEEDAIKKGSEDFHQRVDKAELVAHHGGKAGD